MQLRKSYDRAGQRQWELPHLQRRAWGCEARCVRQASASTWTLPSAASRCRWEGRKDCSCCQAVRCQQMGRTRAGSQSQPLTRPRCRCGCRQRSEILAAARAGRSFGASVPAQPASAPCPWLRFCQSVRVSVNGQTAAAQPHRGWLQRKMSVGGPMQRRQSAE